MVMPAQTHSIPYCPKYHWKNDRIRPAGSSCTEHPHFPKNCPQCGEKTAYCPLTVLENMQYRLGILKGPY